MKQINSQSNLISKSSFASPSYLLTIRSYVYIILIRDPCIFNLYDLHQTGSSHICQKLHQCVLHFKERIPRTHFLLLQPSVRPIPAQSMLLWKGPTKLASNAILYPSERSRQNHLFFHIQPFGLSTAKILFPFTTTSKAEVGW